MRVLITGAQGFAGRYLTARWLACDPDVKIFGCGRSSANDASFTHRVRGGGSLRSAPLPASLRTGGETRYRYIAADLGSDRALKEAIDVARPKVIVHLASGLRDDPTETLLATNVAGMERLYVAVAAAAEGDRPQIVVASSGSVYGAVADDDVPIREETPLAPFDMYSITKVAQEQVARMLAYRFDLPTTIVRIFNVVGPGQDERHFCGQIAAQIVDIERGRRPPSLATGPLTTTRDFIDVRDVADGLIAVAARGRPDTVYNLGSGREATMQEVFVELIALAQVDGEINVARKPGRRADMPRNVAAIDRIAACGFSPRIALRQSLADVLDYYRRIDDGVL